MGALRRRTSLTLCAGQDPTFALGARREVILLTQSLLHERRQFNVELTLSIVRWPSLDGHEQAVATVHFQATSSCSSLKHVDAGGASFKK